MIERDDILEFCLDDLEKGKSTISDCLSGYPGMTDELSSLLTTAERCRRAPAVLPSEEFRTSTRGRMLRVLETAPSSPTAVYPIRRTGLQPRHGLVAGLGRVAAVLVALIIIAGTTATLSRAASPDSPLYPVKLSLEDARVALARSDAERIQLHLDMSDRRLSELASVVGTASQSALSTITNRYEAAIKFAVDRALKEGAAPSLIASVDTRLAAHEQRLTDLLANSVDARGPAAASMRQWLGFVQRARSDIRNSAGAPSAMPNAMYGAQSDQSSPSPMPQDPAGASVQGATPANAPAGMTGPGMVSGNPTMPALTAGGQEQWYRPPMDNSQGQGMQQGAASMPMPSPQPGNSPQPQMAQPHGNQAPGAGSMPARPAPHRAPAPASTTMTHRSGGSSEGSSTGMQKHSGGSSGMH